MKLPKLLNNTNSDSNNNNKFLSNTKPYSKHKYSTYINFYIWTLQKPKRVGTVNIPILQMEKQTEKSHNLPKAKKLAEFESRLPINRDKLLIITSPAVEEDWCQSCVPLGTSRKGTGPPVIKSFIYKHLWSTRAPSTAEMMLLNYGAGEDSWESPGLQQHRTSPS